MRKDDCSKIKGKVPQDYRVYYAGLDIDKPGAIMFDQKNDERELALHKWWDPVKDSDELAEIIQWASSYYSHSYPSV